MHANWKHTIVGLAVATLLLPINQLQASDLPDSVTLDALAELYAGVEFDHASHVSLAEDCSTCHHHTTGTPPRDPACLACHDLSRAVSAVACRDCHAPNPFSARFLEEKEQDVKRYHTDKPGLKAAYHLGCLGCHQEMGGPTGCQDCHQRTEQGDAFYRTGAFAPQGSSAEKTHH